MNSSRYRESHSLPGYGLRYKKTYQTGYYHEQWNRLERPLLEKILQCMAAKGASCCLDFACGTGRILSVLDTLFPVTYGVDVSESMLQIARQNVKRSVILKQDITRKSLEVKFDIVTAFRFFLNAERTLRLEALTAIRDCLNDGGFLIANCHVNRHSLLGLFYRIRNRIFRSKYANTLSYREFRKILEQTGFQVREVHWYSYLPRTGWSFQSFARLMMEPVENAWKAVPFLPKKVAQSFLLVCRKSEI